MLPLKKGAGARVGAEEIELKMGVRGLIVRVDFLTKYLLNTSSTMAINDL